MRVWLTFIGCGIVALLMVWVLAHVLPEDFSFLTSILYGLIVLSAGIGSLLVRMHVEKRSRTTEPDSIERELVRHAGSDAFTHALVVPVAFGLSLVVSGQFVPALAVYGLVLY